MTSPFGMRYHPILHFIAHAHRRRLGRADRHADPRRRQRRHHQGGLDLRLRPARRDPARQRLCDDLQPHVRLRARHRAGRARHPGPGRSAISASPASPPARICTTKSSSTAISSTRWRSSSPRTREFDGKMLAAFKRERDRIDRSDGAGARRRRGVEKPAPRRRPPRLN